MLRLVAVFFVIVLIAFGVFAPYSQAIADDLLWFVFSMTIAAVVLKVVFDFITHHKKKRDDRTAYSRMLNEDNVRSYKNIEEYNQAAQARHQRALRHQAPPLK